MVTEILCLSLMDQFLEAEKVREVSLAMASSANEKHARESQSGTKHQAEKTHDPSKHWIGLETWSSQANKDLCSAPNYELEPRKILIVKKSDWTGYYLDDL